MSPQYQFLHYSPDEPEWSFEFHAIFHDRQGISDLKEMIVAKAAEEPANHAILKVVGPLDNSDSAGMPQGHAKVSCLPRYLFIQADETGSSALHSALARTSSRGNMKVDAAGKVKTTFYRCVNERGELDSNHCLRDALS